jgi:pterin-4a-carbinolamine dehydratase
MPQAFISYRRQDSSAAARWLFDTLRKSFGGDAVFMDVESIRASHQWKALITEKLESSDVVLVPIGPNWLRLTDEYFRRRIDRTDDWVHMELARALELRKSLLPILIGQTSMPKEEALPASLVRLADFQSFELRDERWEQDLRALVEQLKGLGFRDRVDGVVTKFPKPRVTLSELTPSDMLDALAELPGWEPITSKLSQGSWPERTELRKNFEFASFEAALEFMNRARPYISKTQHHPRWENVWRSVTVWLSTWDIGHKPSKLDIDLAKHLDGLAAELTAKH